MHPPVAPWLDRYVGSRTGTCARRPVPNSTTWHPQTSVGGARSQSRAVCATLHVHLQPRLPGLPGAALEYFTNATAMGTGIASRSRPAGARLARSRADGVDRRTITKRLLPPDDRVYRSPRRVALLRHSHSIRVRHEPTSALPDISGRAAGCARWRIS